MSAGLEYFDLNIGEILEAWEPRHAVRELIANALDEQALTGTADISIEQRAGEWIIRDRGRGLKYEHLRQNEDQEELQNSAKVLGRFGFGLKDALATLHRRGVQVEIRTRHGDISIVERPKHGFRTVATLHAAIRPATEPERVGTDIILGGLDPEEMTAAKAFFLRFSDEEVLGSTPFGDILRRRREHCAKIYVKGLLLAEEESFACSYNVTSLTANMERALNRERAHVGRGAYSDRVKSMLLACRTPAVFDVLASEIQKIDQGTAHDEVKWLDVAVHAGTILNQATKVVFASSRELQRRASVVEHARSDGYAIVTVPESIRARLSGLRDETGAAVRSLDVFAKSWSESFTFDFVDENHLSWAERGILARGDQIAELAGGWPGAFRELRISSTMRPSEFESDALGLWEPARGRIVIRRDQLASLRSFAATLLHEIAHARSGASDICQRFEDELTTLLGQIAESHFQRSLDSTSAGRARAGRRRVRARSSPGVGRRDREKPVAGTGGRKRGRGQK